MVADPQDRSRGWAGVWGTIAAIAAGGAFAYWQVAAADQSKPPLTLWPEWVFGSFFVIALYFLFAAVIPLPPYRNRGMGSPSSTGHAAPMKIPPGPGAALPPRPTIPREPLTDVVSQTQARIDRFNADVLHKVHEENQANVRRVDGPSREEVSGNSPDADAETAAREDREMPESTQEWEHGVEESEEGFLIYVIRPPDEEGKIVRCNVIDARSGDRWTSPAGGLQFVTEMGSDVPEMELEFPHDFGAVSTMLPLRPGHFRYHWIANFGNMFSHQQRIVASGEFRRS